MNYAIKNKNIDAKPRTRIPSSEQTIAVDDDNITNSKV